MIELQTMNEIPIYTIIKIEAEEAEIPMLTFYVKEDTMDEPEEISMEELTAYDRNLGIGDQVIIGPDETLFPLDMAENLGMFDEIDPLSQISETDPRQWQMEWMDNYMDALEELEDSTTREKAKIHENKSIKSRKIYGDECIYAEITDKTESMLYRTKWFRRSDHFMGNVPSSWK